MSKITDYIKKNDNDFAGLESLLPNVTVKIEEPFVLIWSSNIDLKNLLEEQLECNGTIIYKEDKDNKFRIVSLGLTRSLDYTDYKKMVPELELDQFDVEPCIDGSLVRMWYNENDKRWQLSTTRKINADESFWSSKKSISVLFREACPFLLYEKLNKNFCYSFILRHPEHHQVFSVKAPSVLHVGTRDMNTLNELDISEMDNRVYWGVKTENITPDIQLVPIPVKYTDFKSFKELEDYVYNLHTDTRGLILKHKTSSIRLKMDSKLYKDMAETRGNVPLLEYRYLQLLSDPAQLEKLKMYYPEYQMIFNAIENHIYQLAVYIQDLYYNIHPCKKGYNSLNNYNKIYETTIRQLHGQFKTSCRNGNRTDTTVQIVLQKLKSLSPFLLAKHLKWW